MVLIFVCLGEETGDWQSGLFLFPVGSVAFALQHFVTSITNLISHGHSYTQKFSTPHNIRILYGDTYKDHYIVIMIMIIVVISNRSFSLTLSAALQIAWNKRKF